MIIELSYDADPGLRCPAEAAGVLSINSHRQRFREVVQSLLGFGNQTPHLAAGYGPFMIGSLSPNLPLTQGIAVALIVIQVTPAERKSASK